MNPYAYIFEGDGRIKVRPDPTWKMPGGLLPVTRAQARVLAQLFEEQGVSYHSGGGYVVWVILAYCHYKGYICTAERGHEFGGWTVHKGLG